MCDDNECVAKRKNAKRFLYTLRNPYFVTVSPHFLKSIPRQMKFSFLLTTTFVAMLSFCAVKSDAKGIPVRFGKVEKVKKTVDLPQNNDYVTSDGKHFDLGCKYTVYEIMWMPAYTVEQPTIVGYVDDKTFIDLTPGELEQISSANKIALNDHLTLPFWDKWGGKLALGLIALLIIYGIFSKDNKPKDAEQAIS